MRDEDYPNAISFDPDAPREIPLTRGYVALIDAEDVSDVVRYCWQAVIDASGMVRARRGYRENGKSKTEMLSAFVLKLHGKHVGYVRHINGDRLDCRKENLESGEGYSADRYRKEKYAGIVYNLPTTSAD